MRHASAHPGDVFARHRIDPHRPDVPARIAAHLREHGLVTVTGLASRTDVLALASRIMTVTEHRDSDSDGITTIRDTGHHAHRAGFAGFGHGALGPHTERSGIPCPPRLMLLVCGQAAQAGGECVLVDGRAVHADLTTVSHEAVTALAQPRSAYFGAGDGHPSQVFTAHADHTMAVRLRLDGLARFSPIVQPYLPQLRAAITRHKATVRLEPGQGYLLDNRRWLHARTGFTGDRVCWRALGQPRFPMPDGFTPAPVGARERLPSIAGAQR
ncbi:TauD/TfdA family dioxygenase [Streptomyces sp. NPDC017940]|uniref:TauD/TfdA family dioxygenase n=1 Tax=Streptomyces sp. NPDC017940 TaxID=3365017 RepID=UPI00378A0BB5